MDEFREVTKMIMSEIDKDINVPNKNDSISRQAALAALGERPMVWVGSDYGLGARNQYDMDRLAIETVSSVDAVPVRHGRWKSRFEGRLHYCSKCGWALMYTQGGEPPYMGDGYNRDNEERWLCRPGWCEDAMRYCPQCGAKMDGKDGEGNGI